MLDNSGVECIRRAARRFPPLCTGIILSRPWTFLPDDEGSRRPFEWSRFEFMCHDGQGRELRNACFFLRIRVGLARVQNKATPTSASPHWY
ncbi:hypothetical protein VMCG_02004 [Cytospora schulzeri]|uniref:Uncharacterized protein n=1 Tax=Cytospora schulzeri TaxID=448051 RepID=A0A423X3U3_9PEZI|nr:hypothetical protein VMCG_02004 [Valsa malicola]